MSQLEPIYYCQNGREGLAHSALKLSALPLSPVDYFENYIFEISRQNCYLHYQLPQYIDFYLHSNSRLVCYVIEGYIPMMFVMNIVHNLSS